MWSFYRWIFTPPLRDANFKSILTSTLVPAARDQPDQRLSTSPAGHWKRTRNAASIKTTRRHLDFLLFLFTWKVAARKLVQSFVQTWKARRSVYQYSFHTCWNIDSFLIGIFSGIHGAPDCAISFSLFHFRCDRSSIDFVAICNILHWPPLSTRRAYFSLSECYKIAFGLSHLKRYCRTF